MTREREKKEMKINQKQVAMPWRETISVNVCSNLLLSSNDTRVQALASIVENRPCGFVGICLEIVVVKLLSQNDSKLSEPTCDYCIPRGSRPCLGAGGAVVGARMHLLAEPEGWV